MARKLVYLAKIMTGKFIVLEGIDGSGTTTQANLLKDYLNTQGFDAIVSSEPTESEIGKLIRKSLKEEIFSFKDLHKFDQQMAILFAADRYYHIFNETNGVLALLEKEIHVLSTRYYFSSLAYNTNTVEDFSWIQNLNCKFPQPDVLIYIDIPVEVSLERISKRKFLEVYEHQEKLLKVSSNYQIILEDYAGLLINVDGRESIEKIHQNILKDLEKII